MDNLLEIIDALKKKKQGETVLATIIKIEGSAYRKEGTSMLISDNERIGMLSVGCLEEELTHQATAMLKNQIMSQIRIYDMSAEHDLGWGRGAGCNGKIHILLEIVAGPLYHHLLQVHELVTNGNTVTVIKSLQENNKWSLYISHDGFIFGDKKKYNSVSKQLLSEQRTTGCRKVLQWNETCFIQIIKPIPRMIVFGAGEDVKPLVIMAKQVGFHVHLWDWRPANLATMQSTEIKLSNNTSISEFVDEFIFKPQDAIIIMTHDFQKDREIIKKIIDSSPPSYIGIMGPENRTNRLLAGNKHAIMSKIDTPIGMSIGAQGPGEIAISILANIIKHIRIADDSCSGKGTKYGQENLRGLFGGG